MPIIVNTNVLSLNAQRYLTNNTNALAKSMERLASGYRINRAGDDAAGLALSENLRAQLRGSQKALANIQDGVGVLNIADGAFNQITENLQRMRELAVQAANDTYATAQRSAIKVEIDQLLSDIDRIANATQFNGRKLLDGAGVTSANGFFIQLGPNTSATIDTIDLTTAAPQNVLATATTTALAATLTATGILVDTNTNARNSLTTIDAALTEVGERRSYMGAFTNRLEAAGNNLSINIENLSASESRIRNVDVAAESAQLVRNQILQQASATILAQANQTPALALQLLSNG